MDTRTGRWSYDMKIVLKTALNLKHSVGKQGQWEYTLLFETSRQIYIGHYDKSGDLQTTNLRERATIVVPDQTAHQEQVYIAVF